MSQPTTSICAPKDILKSALLQFQGTIILVSHDRDFLQGLSTRVFEFKNRKIKEFIGDIYDFIESRNIQNLAELEMAKKVSRFHSTDRRNRQQGPVGAQKRNRTRSPQDTKPDLQMRFFFFFFFEFASNCNSCIYGLI
jgi:ATP-binding cassette, subfamily F, member 3